MANDDELNMLGQFSPPHEPEGGDPEPQGFTEGNNKLGDDGAEMMNMAEIDSPYAFDNNKAGANYGPDDPPRD